MAAAPTRRLRTLDDVPVDGKRTLVRVDFNVSVGADNKVDQYEDYRIEAALPTINELRQRRAKIILVTHLGRPQEEKGNFSLDPVRYHLQDMLGEEIRATKHLTGPEVETTITSLEPGGIVLLPNVRLDEREEKGNQKFAEDLAHLGEVYVSEAFSVCHRPHTSVAFVPHLLPSCAGRRTVLETEVLQKLRESPERPYVGITSGAKISTKVGLLRDLLRQVDKLCLAGQLGNVFLAAQGKFPEGFFSADDVAVAKNILETAPEKLVLPVDVVIGDPEGKTGVRTVAIDEIPPGTKGLWDIGEQSVANIVATCAEAKTIMWNGPLGKVEVDAYAAGTKALGEALANIQAYRVVGGGDTIFAVERFKLLKSFDHVSIGGGAMMEFLEGKHLPGLEPLYEK